MIKIYIVVKYVDGVLKVVAEFENISSCNDYLEKPNHRIITLRVYVLMRVTVDCDSKSRVVTKAANFLKGR